MSVAQPIVYKIEDNSIALQEFEKTIKGDNHNDKLIDSFPTVYIHNWKDNNEYEIYIGESNNIFQRTKQHYEIGNTIDSSWQSSLVNNNCQSFLYIIGHEHFNKSLTLDIENRLMKYMLSVPNVSKVHNGRGNPQSNYYPVEELDEIFQKIWKRLRRDNNELFPSEKFIRDSAIFKASPLHKLTDEQMEAQNIIIERVKNAIDNKKTKQIIFVEGEAGTGKTVLNSSTFYEMCCHYEDEKYKELKCCLIVNHEEQITVYEQICNKLGLTEKYGNVICKPTSFINSNSPDSPMDFVFVDEAHLLWTQGKQSYRGTNQLKDIIDRSRVTIVMFDENQFLNTEQFWEKEILNEYRNISKSQNNYIVLKNQLRMNASEEILNWIDEFTKNKNVLPIPSGTNGYEIKIFDNPNELEKAIINKSKQSDTLLSRMIATYDWPYSSTKKKDGGWCVEIGSWKKPWNYELEKSLSKSQKRQNKKLAWAEQSHTINEIGSTFTIQGFDLNYAGVILGPSVKFENGRIVFDPDKSCNNKATRNRTLSNGCKEKFGDLLLKNQIRVLMTRGVNGLYIYACDSQLRKELLDAQKKGKYGTKNN